jgi:hypothetical protein
MNNIHDMNDLYVLPRLVMPPETRALRLLDKRSVRFIRTLVIALALYWPFTSVSAQDQLFYTGLDYGSQASFNPLTIVLNDAFDVMQQGSWDREVGRIPYADGWATVARTLSHPRATISGYGAWRLVRSELLPLSTKGGGGGQWLPNYQLHLLGGGVLFATTREWYQAHNFKHPGIWSAATMTFERLLNETIESVGFDGYNADALVDLLVFDPAGMLLFSSPKVRRFMSRRMRLRSWPLQPAIGPSRGTLENAGSYFSIQWRLPRLERWHLFYYFGMNNMLGAAYRWDNGLGLSAGGGLHASRLITLDEATNRKTAVLAGTAGVFVDRHGSLLASLVYSGVHDRQFSLNLYPGVLPGGKLSPGLWAQRARGGGLLMGLGLRWLPGVASGRL